MKSRVTLSHYEMEMFRFTQLMFGVKYAPEIFQCEIVRILKGVDNFIVSIDENVMFTSPHRSPCVTNLESSQPVNNCKREEMRICPDSSQVPGPWSLTKMAFAEAEVESIRYPTPLFSQQNGLGERYIKIINKAIRRWERSYALPTMRAKSLSAM